MSKRDLILNKIKIIGFLGYIVILLVERLLAIVLSVNNGDGICKPLTSGEFFPIITYSITCASVLAGVILLIKPCIKLIKGLANKEGLDFKGLNKPLVIGCMVLLFSGMMHTGKTIPGIQFAAYGFLILALIIRAVESIYQGNDKFVVIVSIVYLTALAMAIPVCYNCSLDSPINILFFVSEFAAVFVLIPAYGYITIKYLDNGYSNFEICVPIVMLILSGLTIGLKWTEEINMFLLIFVALTAVIYFTVGLVARNKLKKLNNN